MANSAENFAGARRQKHSFALIFADRTHFPISVDQRGLVCAPRRVLVFQRVKAPPGNLSLQPEAIGAAVEVTKPSKPSMERIALGDSASMQAVTKVNAEQAPKSATWELTRQEIGEGRRCRVHASSPWKQEARVTRLHRPTGVMVTACLQGKPTQHGKPQRWRRVTANETPARDRLGRVG